MRLEIKQLQRELGVTSLYVTHDQVEAMTLADRMIVMNAGKADQIGKPLEVYENPQTEFVAGFIGSPATNFMPAGSVGVNVGKTVGIRPEHIQLTDSPTRLQARVAYCEALGAETLVHLRLPHGQLITVRQGGHLPLPSEGTDLWLGWHDAAMMVFGEDGKRI